MRARVRCEVIPMPCRRAGVHCIQRVDRRQLRSVRQIDLQRRDGDTAALDRVEIGSRSGIGSRPAAPTQ